MRDIKFRGKRKRDGEWIFGDLCRQQDTTLIFPCDATDSYDNYVVESDTVGQCTGSKDKNGVDVYEGDFLQSEKKDMLLEVWYCNEKALYIGEIVNPPSEMVDALYCFETEKMIVVGNKFDNLDLLEEEIL